LWFSGSTAGPQSVAPTAVAGGAFDPVSFTHIHTHKFVSINKIFERSHFQILDAHSSPIFKNVKFLNLMDNVKINNSLLVHDYLNNLLPSCYNNYFSLLSEL